MVDPEKFERYLKALLDETGGDEHAISDMWTLGERLGISRQETSLIVQNLEGDGLLRSTGGAGVGVTHAARRRASARASAGQAATSAGATGTPPDVVGLDRRKVFVVHGRNDNARRALFSFLRALHLEPIEWGQAVTLTGQGSPYIGDVLDAVFLRAQAVVVLLTGDDVARLRGGFVGPDDPPYEGSPSLQPRPNVLFEAGMAFGRKPDRTILVQLGNVRPFSDVAGRHVVKLGNDVASRQDLAVRLGAAGCAVDVSGRDWHTEGDFDSCLWLVPLPRDLTISPPTSDVPEQLARYSGRWEGVWGDIIQHELVVEKVTPLAAEVIYAFSNYKAGTANRGFSRYSGSFDERAILHLQFQREGGEVRVAYRPTPDFSELHASYEYAGRTTFAVMRRVPVV